MVVREGVERTGRYLKGVCFLALLLRRTIKSERHDPAVAQGLPTVCIHNPADYNFELSRQALYRWCNDSITSNVTYFRTRRELLSSFTRMLGTGVGDDIVSVSSALVISIRTFLSMRSDRVSDDNLLAYETAVMELLSLSKPPLLRAHATD